MSLISEIREEIRAEVKEELMCEMSLEMIEEIKKELKNDIKGEITKNKKTNKDVLKNFREKWIHKAPYNRPKTIVLPIETVYGGDRWVLWECIRKITALIYDERHIAQLEGKEYAEEICEELCQMLFNIKVKYDYKRGDAK